MAEVCLNLDLRRDESALVWIVVRTKSNRERLASINLSDRGVEPYCPMLLMPPWHRRAPRGPVPLFPSYIFVRCHPERQLHRMRYCPGVQYPVVFDGCLALVGEDVVDGLRAKEHDRGYILARDIHQVMTPGMRVKVCSGPLNGLQGVFVEYVNGPDRARILVEFLRRMTSVETEITRLVVAH